MAEFSSSYKICMLTFMPLKFTRVNGTSTISMTNVGKWATCSILVSSGSTVQLFFGSGGRVQND